MPATYAHHDNQGSAQDNSMQSQHTHTAAGTSNRETWGSRVASTGNPNRQTWGNAKSIPHLPEDNAYGDKPFNPVPMSTCDKSTKDATKGAVPKNSTTTNVVANDTTTSSGAAPIITNINNAAINGAAINGAAHDVLITSNTITTNGTTIILPAGWEVASVEINGHNIYGIHDSGSKAPKRRYIHGGQTHAARAWLGRDENRLLGYAGAVTVTTLLQAVSHLTPGISEHSRGYASAASFLVFVGTLGALIHDVGFALLKFQLQRGRREGIPSVGVVGECVEAVLAVLVAVAAVSMGAVALKLAVVGK
ncbi:hypothetical protein OQA88_3115 [Cercophora sp. LCS_1]